MKFIKSTIFFLITVKYTKTCLKASKYYLCTREARIYYLLSYDYTMIGEDLILKRVFSSSCISLNMKSSQFKRRMIEFSNEWGKYTKEYPSHREKKLKKIHNTCQYFKHLKSPNMNYIYRKGSYLSFVILFWYICPYHLSLGTYLPLQG